MEILARSVRAFLPLREVSTLPALAGRGASDDVSRAEAGLCARRSQHPRGRLPAGLELTLRFGASRVPGLNAAWAALAACALLSTTAMGAPVNSGSCSARSGTAEPPATVRYQSPPRLKFEERLQCLFSPDREPGERLAARLTQMLGSQPSENDLAAKRALAELAVVNPMDFEIAALSLSEQKIDRLLDAPDWRLSPLEQSARDRLQARYSTVKGIEVEVAPEHRAEVTEMIASMLSGDPAIARRVARTGARLTFIPADYMSPDDVAENHLYRTMRCVRGSRQITGVYMGLTRHATLPIPTEGRGHTVVHEVGHLIRHKGMSRAQRQKLKGLYEEARSCAYPFSNTYWSKNDSEYFSEMTEIYFGLANYATLAELEALHPAAVAFLREIYGPPG